MEGGEACIGNEDAKLTGIVEPALKPDPYRRLCILSVALMRLT